MNACAVAREMLGGMELTPMQVAQQRRTIDHEHQQRLFALLHADGAEPVRAAAPEALAALRAALESGIRGFLTPDQRARLGESRAARPTEPAPAAANG